MTNFFSRLGRLTAFWALVVGLGFNHGAVLAQDSQSKPSEALPSIQYSQAADAVVLEWDQIHDELAVKETIPRLRIFGDGRFEVYYPAYMKKAGLYQGRLSSGEMSDLMSFLAQKGVMDFDRTGLKEEKARVSARKTDRSGEVTAIVDGTITRITIRAQGYTLADGQTKALSNFEKKIQAANINMEAQLYPEIQTLTDLSEVETRLSDLTRRQDLERMEQ